MRAPLAIIVAVVAPIVVRLALLPWWPPPEPRIHDEFSHLLLADTIAHGRVVNPTHPLWQNFDTMHVFSTPVYASPYPPAHGAFMALGQVVTGSPWTGVVLEVGLMCGAIVWMLLGWTSPGWALLGGLLIAARLGVTSYWMNSYYGGAVAAAAGALVLGAAGRLLRRRRPIDLVSASAFLCVGLVTLVHSRPYEGFAYSAAVALMLVVTMRGRLLSKYVWLPMAAVLLPGALATGFWFSQYTGNPLVMPYKYFDDHIKEVPHLWIQSLRPARDYTHWTLRAYYHDWETDSYRAARSNTPPHGVFDKVKVYARFYAGPFLGLAMLAAVILGWRRTRVRWLLFIGIVLSGALVLEVWHGPHYAAPGLAASVLLAIEGLRQLRQTKNGKWIVAALCALSLAVPVWHGGFRVGDGQERAALLKRFNTNGIKQLMIVRYSFPHDVGDEWVYNGADIDSQSVVWARELDSMRIRQLLEYYPGRAAWLVEPDVHPVRVTKYERSTSMPHRELP